MTVKGILHGDGKVPYTLMTENEIVVTVKNSKDAKVEEALKSLVGTTVELAGEHGFGSRDITVRTVNGSEL